MTRLPAKLRVRPPPEALAWAAAAAGDGARVAAVRRLRGGSSAAMHALDVLDRRGARLRLVLRRFVREEWLAEEPDVAEREARVLELLAGQDVPAPRLVAFDGDGSLCGVPAVLMTRLPGRVVLSPPDFDAWLARLAEPLPAVHALGGDGLALVQRYRPYCDLASLAPPSWSARMAAWSRAIEVARTQAPSFSARFIHRDYHPGNVLWLRGRLTGLIDWANASLGPAAIDVAHCRLNLAWLFGVEAADRFLSVYEALSGERHDPYWDLVDLCDSGFCGPSATASGGVAMFRDAGRSDLSPAIMRRRADEYAVSVLLRM